MTKILLKLIFLVSFSCLALAQPDTRGLVVDLGSHHPDEEKGLSLITNFIKNYELSPYLFNIKIKIHHRAASTSSPEIILDTNRVNEPDQFLSQFLHYQIQWYFEQMPMSDSLKKFNLAIKQRYAKIPSQRLGGADSPHVAALKFGVCYYELQALKSILGTKKAIALFQTEETFSWIRKEILADSDFFKKTAEETGLKLP